jgi:hypothetical protein
VELHLARQLLKYLSIPLVNQIAIGTHPKQHKPFVQEHQQSFNVPATGTGLSYQWRKGTTNLTDGGTISGAATATLTINPTVSGDAVRYNVIITGTAPCTPLTSNNATLVINQAVLTITQPPATQTLCSGGTL